MVLYDIIDAHAHMHYDYWAGMWYNSRFVKRSKITNFPYQNIRQKFVVYSQQCKLANALRKILTGHIMLCVCECVLL